MVPVVKNKIHLCYPLLCYREECVKRDCHYYFNIDGDSHLDNPDTLKLLIQQNRSVALWEDTAVLNVVVVHCQVFLIIFYALLDF